MQLVRPASLSFQSRRHAGVPTLSIIVPVYNEQEMLPLFHQQLCNALELLPDEPCEIVYINDGSTDDSWSIMQSLSAGCADIELLNLSRNFGKEAAVTAGLDHVRGDAAILLDADLQDPPALIPYMLKAWREGYDVVEMKRRERHGESAFKKWSAHLYYRLLDTLSDVPIERDVGDFRLLSRRVIDEIKRLPERNRYMKGIMAWPGFRRTIIEFDRPERVAGETKWSFWQLVKLAMAGITSFSVKPLKMATWAGALVSGAALIYGLVILSKTLLFGEPVAGYPSMMLAILWLSGVQLIAIGVLGEYVGRIFVESKGRPVYLVMDNHSIEATEAEVRHG